MNGLKWLVVVASVIATLAMTGCGKQKSTASSLPIPDTKQLSVK